MWASLAWDGILPAVVAVLPWLVVNQWPEPGPHWFAAAVLAPIAAALLRVHIAQRQIRRLCRGELPDSRQVLLGTAIVLLLIFEVSTGLLTVTSNAPKPLPPIAWAVPAVAYGFYILCVRVALRPDVVDPADELRTGDQVD